MSKILSNSIISPKPYLITQLDLKPIKSIYSNYRYTNDILNNITLNSEKGNFSTIRICNNSSAITCPTEYNESNLFKNKGYNSNIFRIKRKLNTSKQCEYSHRSNLNSNKDIDSYKILITQQEEKLESFRNKLKNMYNEENKYDNNNEKINSYIETEYNTLKKRNKKIFPYVVNTKYHSRNIINQKLTHISNTDYLLRKNYDYGTKNPMTSFKEGLRSIIILKYLIHDKHSICKNLLNLSESRRKQLEIINPEESLLLSSLKILGEKDTKEISSYLKFLGQTIEKESEENRALITRIGKLKAEIHSLKYRIVQGKRRLRDNLDKRNFLICVKERVKNLPIDFQKKAKDLLISEGGTKAVEKLFKMNQDFETKSNRRRRHSVFERKNSRIYISKEKVKDEGGKVTKSLFKQLTLKRRNSQERIQITKPSKETKYDKYLLSKIEIFKNPEEFHDTLTEIEDLYLKKTKKLNENKAELYQLQLILINIKQSYNNKILSIETENDKFKKTLEHLKDRNFALKERIWKLKKNLKEEKNYTDEEIQGDNKQKLKKNIKKNITTSNTSLPFIKHKILQKKKNYKRVNSYIYVYVSNIVNNIYKYYIDLFLRKTQKEEIEKNLKIISEPEFHTTDEARKSCKFLMYHLIFAVEYLYEEYKRNLEFKKEFILKKKYELEIKRRVREASELRVLIEERKRMKDKEILIKRESEKYKILNKYYDPLSEIYYQFPTNNTMKNEEGFDIPIIRVGIKGKKYAKLDINKQNDESDFIGMTQY